MLKVKATDAYEINKITDNELKRIPKKGEEFVISDSRYELLSGNNSYGLVFVEKVEEKKIQTKAFTNDNKKKNNVKTRDIQD